MKTTHLALAALLIGSTAQAQNGKWTHTVEGTAYDRRSKEPLRNTDLIIGRDTVRTDANGHYTYTLRSRDSDCYAMRKVRRIRSCYREEQGTVHLRRLGSERSRSILLDWRKLKECDTHPPHGPCGTTHQDIHLP